MAAVVLNCVLITIQFLQVYGHGRLMDPPSRNSMWRYGFPNPVNYNDNELYCGGYSVHWNQNKGKCGICGDSYDKEQPRPHEAGGTYANGIVTRRYASGQEINIEVELTTNHFGRFEINLCPNNNPQKEVTQECLDKYPLRVVGQDDYRYILDEDGPKKAIFHYSVQLPPYLTCTQCVLQWNYYTGNQWGLCDNGTYAQGCGKSELFRNCADISVVTNVGAAVPPLFVEVDNPYLLFFKDRTRPAPYNVYPLIVRHQVCQANDRFKALMPGMDEWCQSNCLKYPPNCPKNICTCPTTCEAVGEHAGQKGADQHCMDQCIVYPPKCPSSCQCRDENQS